MGRETMGESREAIEQRQEEIGEKLREADRRMEEGVSSGAVVERTAQEIIARMTRQGQEATQRALESAHGAAVERVGETKEQQEAFVQSEANPFQQEQLENAQTTEQSARVAEAGAREALVDKVQQALNEAVAALEEDAQFLERVGQRQQQATQEAGTKATQHEQTVRSQRPSLRR